ncbi:5'-methylthioadenosine/S-adenosylhomocysteine nucleosidase [Actinophytocola oryzae]|uniref:Nucleoside phosphorylase n=1 Tax=Actinophytocola oryzae TaxID=502181 RepID=A0A4R7VW23_9PSEU|nr:5'-methylthioadenosine/S-adenosylhomocysteine nucleosidase [Actinophytocola oryzae]TDV53845.1 nucleoside phosphorylase [Actinophytocola oryzae]
MTDDIVVILTALDLEYKAVRQKLVNPRVHTHDTGTRFEVGTIQGTNRRVALGFTNKGNHASAVLAERAIREFSPVAVLFVGVAGALWDTPLGDVVVATHVYGYHGGTSEDDGLKARPRVWEMAHGISQLAAHLARTGEWMGDLPVGARVPKVHLAPIAAGEVVQNSKISYHAKWIQDHYNDAVAIEMEGAGVAQAGHLNAAPVAIVRGISDRADGTKTTEADHAWQPRAADNAAAFAVRLAEELIKERGHMHESDKARNGGSVSNSNNSGQVGIQAQYVSGSTVNMGVSSRPATTADLSRDLAAFRDQLKCEHATGKVDDATYVAAEAELDIACKALDTDSPQGKSTFVLALKRLHGLIADVAELVAPIATLIAAVKGLT